MGKYSSDSDSDRYSRKSRKDKKSNRRRRSSSSSDSSSSRSSHSYSRKSQYKSRRRSSSTEKHRSTRDRHSKYRSDNKKSRKRRSRSRSRSYIREFTSTSRRSSTSSSKSESSYKKSAQKDIKKQTNKPDIDLTINPAVKQKIEESEVVHDPKVLQALNEDSFEQQEFTSKSDTIVIDLQKQTIKVPQAEARTETENIFHHNLFQPEEVRVVKWLKELYSYRHRALQSGANKL